MNDGELFTIKKGDIRQAMYEREYLFDDVNTKPPLYMSLDRVKVKTFKTSILLNGMFKAGFVHRKLMKKPIEYNGETFNVSQFVMHLGCICGEVSEATILHEMTHIYVLNFEEYHSNKTTEELIERIRMENGLTDSYLEIALSICECGEGHDKLFYYKSLELDVIKDYPLGTVFGYGMHEYIQHCQAVAEIAG